MIFLLADIMCGLTISILMKKKSGIVHNEIAMFMANYIVCTLLSFYYTGRVSFAKGSSLSLYIGFISGFFYLFSFVLSDINIKKNGIVMATAFSKLGVIIPTLMGLVLFREALSPLQTIGIMVAICGIVTMYFEKSGTAKVSMKWLLFVHLFSSGVTSVCASLYDHYGLPVFKDQFLLFNFIFALMFSVITLLYRKQKFGIMDLLWGFMIGVPNYFSARFMLKALETVPSVIAFPFISVGSIVSITLCGVLLFKEPFSKRKGAAIGMIALALALLNL